MLYARNVTYRIQDGKIDDFYRVFDKDVLPMLTRQPGFETEFTLMDHADGVGISFWRDRASAEKYERDTYPKVVETLLPFLAAEPSVHIYAVGMSTLPG